MKRVISLPLSYANKIGTVVNIQYFTGGESHYCGERVGSIKVDGRGCGTYYPKRSGYYKMVFGDNSEPIVDLFVDFGDMGAMFAETGLTMATDDWTITQEGTSLVFRYKGTEKWRVTI